ncbi:MAG: glycerol-3-phosphate dehydrogenase [Burkholderiaceae bacterium]|nr:glycerol-3-phosphate dehydrogenase [Sulfuritalea sp.]MCF8174526.1 glycerol-3-phosphate dehydrogenase [Burkholderiaceae bacterium]
MNESPDAGNQNPPASAAGGGTQDCDVLVVGGGINGVGIARDLAGRGWRVVLVEQDDLGAHTSSASSKLIHGGLRYLEYYEFAMVRKALLEREVLLRSAPHIIRPLRFVMPHEPTMRPVWWIRLGLFLYDHLARREVLPGSQAIDLRRHPVGTALQDRLVRGFVYSDGWVDDARLVVLNALDAHERGAKFRPRTRCVAAQRSVAGWTASLQATDGQQSSVTARLLVNAAGPWAETFLRSVARSDHGEVLATRHQRLVKGSHIVVPRCFDHDHAYVFQDPQKRIIFAIPYEEHFTMIGTTDSQFTGDPGEPRIDVDETAYLCEQASRYFKRSITPADVVWSFSGVRPLFGDTSGALSAITRDYLLESNTGAAPLLSVWGGKITTYRKLAEEAANEIGRALGECRDPWTEKSSLPGGDLRAWIGSLQRPDLDIERFIRAVRERYHWIEPSLAERLSRAYGSRIDRVLDDARQVSHLGEEVAPGLFEVELRYLCREEWALAAEDVLWRRSKLGLHYAAAESQRVAEWLEGNASKPSL